MDYYDKADSMKNLFKEFERIDDFRNAFKAMFNIESKHIIHQYFPTNKDSSALTELLNEYAINIMNATESVIDKDKSYPDYRMSEELERMTMLANKSMKVKQHEKFRNDLNQKVKALMVEHFSKIYDLSANGFRLLNANAIVYHRHFIYHFYDLK